MLIEFYGQNYGCFRDEFRLSMLAADIDPSSDRGIVEVVVKGDDDPLRLLRAVAVYGPNASGKSTLLRAAGEFAFLIRKTASLGSDSLLDPYRPFGLDTQQSPVRLGASAVIEGEIYNYEVRFLRSHFISERLTILQNNAEPTVLLDRQDQVVVGRWTQEPQFALIATDFRPNALLLSLADRLAPGLAKNIAVGFRRLLGLSEHRFTGIGLGRSGDAARRAHSDTAFADWLTSRLKSADIGVDRLTSEEIELQVRVRPWPAEPPAFRVGDDIMGRRKAYQLKLTHGTSDRSFTVPYQLESRGTQRLVELSPLLYDLMHSAPPIVAFVDELHESLHPKLFEEIIRDFNCSTHMKAACGQLIFATHETSLLDAEAKNAVLRRDQIYLTEKDASGAARLYSVAEFGERNNLNIRRRYLQGRYGALPSLGGFSD